MFFSNTHWPQTAPFYWILFETSICQFNCSKCSPIMSDEVREHLTRDQRPFLHPESTPDPLDSQLHDCASSLQFILTHFLQGSGQRTGMAIAEAWFCAQWPIFVLLLRIVFGLLSGWKIQTWPIIRFLTVSHLLIFYLLAFDRIHDAINKMSRTSSWNIGPQHQKYSSIFHCTHGVLLSVFTKPNLSVCC